MKKIFYSLIIVTMMLLAFGAEAQAQGPSGQWSSSIYCVNQEDTDAAINLLFYSEDGTLAHSFTDTIAGKKAVSYYPADLAGLGSFTGALVIQSDKGLSCSTQTASSSTGTQADPFMLGASGGFDMTSAAPTMYVTQVLKDFDSGIFGHYESYIAIQNASDSEVTVTVRYTDRRSWVGAIPAANRQYTIPANSNKVVYLEENNNLPAQFLGSAIVSSNNATTPLAVQVVIYNDGSSPATSQFLMYNGVSSGESVLQAPFVMRNFYDFNTGMNVLNAGDTATAFKIEFTIGRLGAPQTFTYQHPNLLQPGELVALYGPDIAALDPVDALPMSERAGSAIITATNTSGAPSGGLLAANVNIRNDGRDPFNPNFGGQGSTYNAVGGDQASQTLYVPNVQNKVTEAEFTSGINVANLTSTAGSCTYVFTGQPGVSWTKPLPANGIYSVLASNITGLNAGYSDGVIINCTVDAIAIITMRADSPTSWGDSQTGFNALKSP